MIIRKGIGKNSVLGKNGFYLPQSTIPQELLTAPDIPTQDIAVAYSLRQLPGYQGNCIKVTRSIDNATLDVGFLDGVVDMDLILSFVGTNSASIEVWYDQSGNGKNQIQLDPNKQFLIVENGVPLLYNEKYGLKSTTSTSMTANAVNIAQPSTYFLVAGMNAGTANSYFIDGDANRNIIGRYQTGTKWFIYAGSFADGEDFSAGQKLHFAVFKGNDSNISTNQGDLIYDQTSTSSIDNLNLSESGFGVDGFYQELIIYSKDISDKRGEIENNINSFYEVFPLHTIKYSNVNLVFDGNSLTRSNHNNENQVVEQFMPKEVNFKLQRECNNLSFSSFGVGGQTISNMIADYSTQIAPLYDPTKTNILVINEDANGIFIDNDTGQGNLDKINTYLALAQSTGFEIILTWNGWYTRTPYWVSLTESDRQRRQDFFNLVDGGGLIGNTNNYDGRTSPDFGGAAGQAQNQYFYDYIHLTRPGYRLLAEEMFQFIKNELDKI